MILQSGLLVMELGRMEWCKCVDMSLGDGSVSMTASWTAVNILSMLGTH
jgi:hypothetical protein